MNNTRPSITKTMIEIAYVMAKRSTCVRRQVGCVLTDEDNHILSTGFNGVAAGETHCTDHNCAGALSKSGEGLDLCEAIHAEANALLQCKDIKKIKTAYCTTQPCVHCVKLLMNTTCQLIVFVESYGHGESENLWKPRQWFQVERNWTKKLTPNLITSCVT